MIAALQPSYPLLSRRLLIRPLRAPDADALAAYRSEPDVCRYVPFEPMTSEAVRFRIHGPWSRICLETEGQALVLGIEELATQELVGDVTLIWVSERHERAEIGYVLNPVYARRGYATEATHRLLHVAFDDLGFHRVVARIIAGNNASVRLATRLGMRQEGRMIQHEWFKGAWIDELCFALLDQEWRAHHDTGNTREEGCPVGSDVQVHEGT